MPREKLGWAVTGLGCAGLICFAGAFVFLVTAVALAAAPPASSAAAIAGTLLLLLGLSLVGAIVLLLLLTLASRGKEPGGSGIAARLLGFFGDVRRQAWIMVAGLAGPRR